MKWRLGKTVAAILTTFAALTACGCATTGHRNLRDSIVMTASPTLAESDVACALELRDRREGFKISESDAFLASERGGRLDQRLKSEILRRRDALRRTITRITDDLADGLAICPPDTGKPIADGNIVVYVKGKAGTRILFSCDEIAQLLSLSEVGDDLTRIRYTHPDFESDRLGELRDQMVALGLDVRNTTFTSAELDEMKTAAAARIIERHLRESGASLSPNVPLLTTGLLSTATHSPKLTAALQDQSVVERIVRANNPELSRALMRLTRLDVVELSYP